MLKTTRKAKGVGGKAIGVVVLGAAILFVIAGWCWSVQPTKGRIARNVFIGAVAVGNLTPAEATSRLNDRLDVIDAAGWHFRFETEAASIDPTPGSLESASSELATLDTNKAVVEAMASSRGWRWPWQSRHQEIAVPVTVQTSALEQELRQTFPSLERTQMTVGFRRENGVLVVTPPTSGRIIDSARLRQDVAAALSRLETPEVTIVAEESVVPVTVEEAATLLPWVQPLILDRLSRITLQFEDQKWKMTEAQLLPELTVVRTEGKLVFGLRSAFGEHVLASIAQGINQAPTQPKFKMENGRVTLWQAPAEGRALDTEASIAAIEEVLNSEGGDPTAKLMVKTTAAPPVTDDMASFGVREIIGVGKSNFAGSPKNRRHNIAVGAAAVHGIVVKPGEEFSLIKTLGAIDASTGYLPELVIKGNRTIPEYGGGLCQIGTTTFRATLSSGLPILERQNHSYRVVYYEPAGTDATIYDPKPDFRFLNDMANPILIQTTIKGDEITFEFWGTKDGRQVSQTKPRVYNIRQPAPTKMIETLDVKPGEKKCTESAHAGADAEFTYTVVYADGTKKEQVFKSHYKPWQAVCLIGVAQLSPPPPADGAAAPVTPLSPDTLTPAAP